jgi:antitoxin HigA-1
MKGPQAGAGKGAPALSGLPSFSRPRFASALRLNHSAEIGPPPKEGDFWAVTVRANWRVIFRFEGEDAADVDLIDYHEEDDTMRMKNPPHPGEHVLEDCLKPSGLSITKGADVLGVTRLTLSNLVNGKNGVSPEMAIRLSKAFGGSPEVWLGMQMEYDLAQAAKNEAKIKVKRVRAEPLPA